jgi:hypothetical protein
MTLTYIPEPQGLDLFAKGLAEAIGLIMLGLK